MPSTISGLNLANAPAVAIDFETYYRRGEYEVSSQGYWAYTHDPRFSCYLAGVGLADGTACARPPAEISAADWTDLVAVPVWVSHNAAFDQAVFLRMIELGLVPAGTWPRRWLCTSAMAAYIQAPRSLAGAARLILRQEVNKGYRTPASGYQPGTDLFLDQELARACEIDAVICARLWAKVGHLWPAHERALWEATIEAGRCGITLDQRAAAAAVATLKDRAAAYAEALPWTKEGEKPTSSKAFELACINAGVTPPDSTDDDDAGFIQWAKDHQSSHTVTWVRHMQGWRRANRMAGVYQAMLNRYDPKTGRMDFELVYMGADGTGRWSGGGVEKKWGKGEKGGFNIQNLNRDEVEGVPSPRHALIPAPGCSLVIADLSQIEPRCLAWLTGDEPGLAQMRAGVSPYEAHARTTMGWAGGELKKENRKLYAYAKVRVLQLGYQSAAETFQASAAREGIEITITEAERQVCEFRKSSPLIVTLWQRVMDAFTAHEGGTYSMPLPSGRTIRYFDIHPQKGARGRVRWFASSVKGEPPDDWYGGKLCENLVQATARDVFAWLLLRLESESLFPLFHVHDEVVLEAPTGQAEAVKARVLSIMSETPPWIPGLPVAAEAEIAAHYKK